jgi:hypothetical protein
MGAMTPPSKEQMLARQLVVAEAMTPTRRLAIQQSGTEITVTSELHERTFPINGAVVKDGQGDAVIKRRLEWRKDGLVLAAETQALRTRQTLRLQPDNALEVQIQVEDRMFDKPIKVRRVYERARVAEAMPAGSPQPDASDSFRPPAPASLDEPPRSE